MSIGIMNDPSTGVQTIEIECVNNSGVTLYDGYVVVKDLAAIAAAPATWLTANAGNPRTWLAPEYATSTSTAYDTNILGVVRCSDSAGVLAGGRMTVMTRGFHPGVLVPAGCATGAVTLMTTGSTATAVGSVIAVSAGCTIQGIVGNLINGTVAVTASATAKVPMLIHVKG